MVDFSPTSPFAAAGSARLGAVSAPTTSPAADARGDFRGAFQDVTEAQTVEESHRRSAREDLCDGTSNALSAVAQADAEPRMSTEHGGDPSREPDSVVENGTESTLSPQQSRASLEAAATGNVAAEIEAVRANPTVALSSPAVSQARVASQSVEGQSSSVAPFLATVQADASTSVDRAESGVSLSSVEPIKLQLSPKESTQALQLALALRPQLASPSQASTFTSAAARAQQPNTAKQAATSALSTASALELPFSVLEHSFLPSPRMAGRAAMDASAHEASRIGASLANGNASAQAIASRLTAVESQIALANQAETVTTIEAEPMPLQASPNGATAASTPSLANTGVVASQIGMVQSSPSAPQATQAVLLAPEFAAASAPAPELAAQSNSKLVARGLAALTQQRGGTLSIRLDPPELGAVQVKMVMDQGSVRVDFRAATPEARAILEMHLGALRGALESQGLHVDRLQVEGTATPSTLQRGANAEQASAALASGDRRATIAANTHNDASQDRSNQQQSSARQDSAHGESRGRQDHGARSGSGTRARAADALQTADSFASALLNGARS